jgi:hypothetical protein
VATARSNAQRNRPPKQQHDQERTATMAKDVTVTPQNPLYVTDDNRTFGTVTIQPGGQIFIQTTADVRIDTLIKK